MLLGSQFVENIMVALDVIRLFGKPDPPRLSDVEIAIPFRVNTTIIFVRLDRKILLQQVLTLQWS